ncbi:MAG: TspO/MBR family protein [Anaerolineae bacterium]
MNRDLLRQAVNLAALVFALAVNGLAEAIPLNGQTSAQIANRLPILFVPANYVFSIWGVIYVFMIGFGIYQALPSQRENSALRRIGYWFALSCLANGVWLILFHYDQFPLSMVAMIVLLVSLIIIYTRVGVGLAAVKGGMKWWVHTTFSIYLGWITVATVANAAYVLFDAKWDGLGISPELWTIALLLVATGLTLAFIYIRRDVAYTMVILWALVGIVVKQSATPSVAIASAMMVLIIIVALVLKLWIGRQPGHPLVASPA